MNKKIKFSIVIPIYNSSKYIDDCLKSVINQTYENYEIILIDDGSCDDSLEKCKKWKNRDSRITLFHQENAGASSARNLGLNNVKGDYIQFLDSDDTLVENCLWRLNELICKYNNPDFIEFRLNYIGPNGVCNIQGTILDEGYYDRNYLENKFLPIMLNTISDESVYYNIFNVLRCVKKDLIINNNIKFNANIKRWEDKLFALEIISKAEQMIVTKDSLYNYYGHVGGGLGGKYNPSTYYYVKESYETMDNLFGEKYDMFSTFSINSKLDQIERCLNEIYNNESLFEFIRIIKDIASDDYFINLINNCENNNYHLFKILLNKKQFSLVSIYLLIYLFTQNSKRTLMNLLRLFYHKFLKKDWR